MSSFLKKILWATDFSKEAGEAFLYADYFAKSFKSSLIALHVIPDPSPVLYRSSYVIGKELRKGVGSLKREAEKRLEKFKNAKKESFPIIIKEGNPAKKIIETAEEKKADLIVIGKRGISAIEKLLIGSVANQVLRNSQVPVLITKKRTKKPRIKKILVPTDFSPQEEMERDFALKLARVFKADLTLLHVLALYDYKFSPSVLDEMFETIMAKLKKRKRKEEEEIKVKEEITRAITASAGIVDFGETNNCDLIVVSTYVQSKIERFFLGSTTEKVISYTDIPVFAIPPLRSK